MDATGAEDALTRGGSKPPAPSSACCSCRDHLRCAHRSAVLFRRQPRADRAADGDRLHRRAGHDDGHRVRRYRSVSGFGRGADDRRHRRPAPRRRQPVRGRSRRHRRRGGLRPGERHPDHRAASDSFHRHTGNDDPRPRSGERIRRRAANRSAVHLAQRSAANRRSG